MTDRDHNQTARLCHCLFAVRLRTDHKNMLRNVENELNAVKSVGDREHRYSEARGMAPMCPLRVQAVRS